MSEYSIEILGQKFSYPSTWQGTFSVLIVCVSIASISITLSPEQIKSFGVALGTEYDQQFEKELVGINEKLNSEISSLKEDLLRLARTEIITEPEKIEIVSKVEASEKAINDAYADAIESQVERREIISSAIPSSNQQQQRILSIEEARIVQQIGQLQLQQQQQQQQQR